MFVEYRDKGTHYTDDGNINVLNYYGKHYEGFTKNKNKTTMWFGNPTSVYTYIIWN